MTLSPTFPSCIRATQVFLEKIKEQFSIRLACAAEHMFLRFFTGMELNIMCATQREPNWKQKYLITTFFLLHSGFSADAIFVWKTASNTKKHSSVLARFHITLVQKTPVDK